LPARCAVMPAKSGSGDSQARPVYEYLIRFDRFRMARINEGG
jgi:hypothetical protein